jgi:hypothetical protein
MGGVSSVERVPSAACRVFLSQIALAFFRYRWDTYNEMLLANISCLLVVYALAQLQGLLN